MAKKIKKIIFIILGVILNIFILFVLLLYFFIPLSLLLSLFFMLFPESLKADLGFNQTIAINPLTEKQIISYFEHNVYNETGDNVTVNIISKEKLQTCVFEWNVCMQYQDVKNGYSYELEIVNNNNKQIIGEGKYKDAYTINKEKYDAYFWNNYNEHKLIYNLKDEIRYNLNKLNLKYYIFDYDENDADGYGYTLFINLDNIQEMYNVTETLGHIMYKYNDNQPKNDFVKCNLSIYQYLNLTDDNIFNNTNFDLYNSNLEYDRYSGNRSAYQLLNHITDKSYKIQQIDNNDLVDYLENGNVQVKPFQELTKYKGLVFFYHESINGFQTYGFE